jgi:hypothetical protein
VGSFDVASASTGRIRVSGWAIDPDTTDSIAVHVYVDATATPFLAANIRPDLELASPGYGIAHGFDVEVAAGRGTHQVCVYAINNLLGAANTLLSCRSVAVP